ncbi:MAG: hypothetical protein Q8P67_16695 [archaeon]|nr:hypothetical protein [archaeon]
METFPARHSDKQDFLRTLELALLYAKTVTLGSTPWPESNAVMARNRRIGTSMSGIAQFIAQHGLDELRDWCDTGYAQLRADDEAFSKRFGVPTSIKLTSIKPSGTVSLLAGATPGMHYPISSHYIRRVRLPANSTLVSSLQNAGYHVEPAVEGQGTAVVEFPVCAGDHVPRANDVSLWDQLTLAAFLQRHWADNSVSCTVSFDPEKQGASTLTSALDHFQYQLKGISFLPNHPHVYPQMPYEEIDEATYLQRSANIKPVVWEQRDSFIPKEHEFCDGDKCVLPS